VRWGKKRISGTDYDLSHLEPFLMEVTPKAEGSPTYTVRVSFGCHTFTRELVEEDSLDLQFWADDELRCFCFDRYLYSTELPEIVRYAAKGRVYFSERTNFLIVERLEQANAPYVAFFNVEKAEKKDHECHVVMFVTSAHLRPALPDKLPPVTFATLIDYTARGKALVRPEPRKIIPGKRK
jgi:hypothetical protein